MDFGSNIKRIRKRCNMTQKELSEKLHVTFQAISRWENNAVEPSIDTIKNMIKVFDCTYEELFEENTNEKDE